MLVPSLSWQNDHFSATKNGEKGPLSYLWRRAAAEVRPQFRAVPATEDRVAPVCRSNAQPHPVNEASWCLGTRREVQRRVSSPILRAGGEPRGEAVPAPSKKCHDDNVM